MVSQHPSKMDDIPNSHTARLGDPFFMCPASETGSERLFLPLNRRFWGRWPKRSKVGGGVIDGAAAPLATVKGGSGGSRSDGAYMEVQTEPRKTPPPP